jgi:hypothetical protein
VIDYVADAFCASSDVTRHYQKMVKYYHQIPMEIAVFMEQVLINLKFVIEHQHLTSDNSDDLNKYFQNLKNIYLKHYRKHKKVQIRISIKQKPKWKTIFGIPIKFVSEVVDLHLIIDEVDYDYLDILLQFKVNLLN